jgi:hypothetical protein
MLVKVIIELDGIQLSSVQQALQIAMVSSQSTFAEIQRQIQVQVDREQVNGHDKNARAFEMVKPQ